MMGHTSTISPCHILEPSSDTSKTHVHAVTKNTHMCTQMYLYAHTSVYLGTQKF